MSYIYPNGKIVLLKGVPLDKSYNHTIYFANASAQYNAINNSNFTPKTYPSTSYQRVNKNTLRIADLPDNLYNYNYLMFQNDSDGVDYSQKWFYAFIDKIDYVNNNCCEVTYTIDVMQTWYFDYELGSCFVEREHTTTDVVGENITPENLDCGELIPAAKYTFTYPNDTSPSGSSHPRYTLVVFYVPNEEFISSATLSNGYYTYNWSPIEQTDGSVTYFNVGELVDGIYAGCKYWSIPMLVSDGTEVTKTKRNINNLVNAIIDKSGHITNMCQVPYDLWASRTAGEQAITLKNIIESSSFYNPANSTHYEPRNKKLLTSPYKNIVVSNNAGSTATYNWEYFSTRESSTNKIQATFIMQGVPLLNPEIMCYPTNYRNIDTDYESGLILNDFPNPPWDEDSFSKWWSQNKDAYVTSLVSTAVISAVALVGAAITVASAGTGAAAAAGGTAAVGASLKTGAAVVGGVGTAVGAGAKIANTVASKTTAKNTPDQISGQASISSLRTIQNRIGFYFYDMGITKEKAEIIDNYFDMFGYAINKVKKPNIKDSSVSAHLRPSWNYIKTNGCIIHGTVDTSSATPAKIIKAMPADAEEAISQIYDKGITFWMDITKVGDYAQGNLPQ